MIPSAGRSSMPHQPCDVIGHDDAVLQPIGERSHRRASRLIRVDHEDAFPARPLVIPPIVIVPPRPTQKSNEYQAISPKASAGAPIQRVALLPIPARSYG